MAFLPNIGFAVLCGIVLLGADYGQQSRQAQIPFGQMSLKQYGQVFSSRFDLLDSRSKIAMATTMTPTRDEASIDPNVSQLIADPAERQDRIGVRVNKGLTHSEVGGGCVRRGNILNC